MYEFPPFGEDTMVLTLALRPLGRLNKEKNWLNASVPLCDEPKMFLTSCPRKIDINTTAKNGLQTSHTALQHKAPIHTVNGSFPLSISIAINDNYPKPSGA